MNKAEKIVAAVLDHIKDRRPFKWNLSDMKDAAPGLYREMLEDMREDVQKILDDDTGTAS